MIAQAVRAFGMLAILTAITGVAYPLVVTGVAKIAFPTQANGSLVVENGSVIGSTLIGQSFDDPKYFWGRISATAPAAYDAQNSAASNLGPTNDALTKAAKDRIDVLRKADPDNDARVPIDLVTSSGSGLDPHVSVAAARYQVKRVARARGVDESVVAALVDAHVEDRQLGVFGEPRVNVLMLNRALDQSLR